MVGPNQGSSGKARSPPDRHKGRCRRDAARRHRRGPGAKGKKQKYDLILSSIKEKKILSKDSKGDPSIFELIINVNYVVKKDGEILIENKINRKTTYNNITDKFELENYEKNIVDNLSKNISDKIIFSISEIHK